MNPNTGSKIVDELQNHLREFTNIKDRFVVLSQLEAGCKIWITVDPVTSNKIFQVDNNTIKSPFTRWWDGGQSRENTINILVDDTNYIQKNFKYLPKSHITALSIVINNAIPGIENLKQIYSGNKQHEDTLNEIIMTLRRYI